MYEDVLERLAQASSDAEQEADEALMKLADSALPVDERIRLRSVQLRQRQVASNMRDVVNRAVAAGHGTDILTRFASGNYALRRSRDAILRRSGGSVHIR